MAKYFDTSTVTTLPSDKIFDKYREYTSDEQVEKLTRESNIHYRFLLYNLFICYQQSIFKFCSTKLAKFSSNPGKVHFEGLVHLMRHIRDIKTLGLKYYDDMRDATFI